MACLPDFISTHFLDCLKAGTMAKGEGGEVSSYSKCLMERGKTGFCGAGLKAIRGNPKQAMVGFRPRGRLYEHARKFNKTRTLRFSDVLLQNPTGQMRISAVSWDADLLRWIRSKIIFESRLHFLYAALHILVHRGGHRRDTLLRCRLIMGVHVRPDCRSRLAVPQADLVV
jgi:hypothetical protein